MAIEHKRLGKHGVLVSNICLGTMNFGWHTSPEESFKIMDRALELGINFFDTADVYGWGGEQGDTEEILGRWFAQGGGRRDAVVLATKVFNPVKRKANLAEPNTDGRSLSAYKIRKALRRQPDLRGGGGQPTRLARIGTFQTPSEAVFLNRCRVSHAP